MHFITVLVKFQNKEISSNDNHITFVLVSPNNCKNMLYYPYLTLGFRLWNTNGLLSIWVKKKRLKVRTFGFWLIDSILEFERTSVVIKPWQVLLVRVEMRSETKESSCPAIKNVYDLGRPLGSQGILLLFSHRKSTEHVLAKIIYEFPMYKI